MNYFQSVDVLPVNVISLDVLFVDVLRDMFCYVMDTFHLSMLSPWLSYLTVSSLSMLSMIGSCLFLMARLSSFYQEP